MKKTIGVAFLVVVSAILILAQAQQQGAPNNGLPPWAYNVPEKVQPQVPEAAGMVHLPGSTKEYPAKDTESSASPPDWFPDEHPPAPPVVTGAPGRTSLACGSCHLMSGQGHPESADLAGLPVDYVVRQMAYFKSGARRDPARMNAIAKTLSEEDVLAAAQYFHQLKPRVWVKVIESDTAPKTYVSNKGRMRLPLPDAGTEPLGMRIISQPQDAFRTLNRDPHSPFFAYVPRGSIERGEALVRMGGSGKTIQCAICHGDSLTGIGDVPRIAGLQPVYIARQLYDFQNGSSNGAGAALMKKVVAKLSDEDIISISAYAGSQAP